MSNVIVPYESDFDGLPQSHAEFHAGQFQLNRESVLSELRCLSGLPELARTLVPGNLYRLVWPEGHVLQRGADGLFRGDVRGPRGQIKGFARFAEVRPNLM